MEILITAGVFFVLGYAFAKGHLDTLVAWVSIKSKAGQNELHIKSHVRHGE